MTADNQKRHCFYRPFEGQLQLNSPLAWAVREMRDVAHRHNQSRLFTSQELPKHPHSGER